MSLTSFLNNKDVRQRFRLEFRKPPFLAQSEILTPPISNNYSHVGVAFDYLLRFYLQHLNSDLAKTKKFWVAEHALDELHEDPNLHSAGEDIIGEAKVRLHHYLKTGQMTRELMESALLLATLDPIYRSGFGHEFVGKINSADIKDLENMLSIVDPKIFKAQELCLLNPNFDKASTLVGGADADLIIDDTLIDIKTSQYCKIPRDDFNQIVGYYVLHVLGGVGGLEPKPKINKVGIYFSRYAYLLSFEMDSIINRKTFPDFLAWFNDRAKQEYKEVIEEKRKLEAKLALLKAKNKIKRRRRRTPSQKTILALENFTTAIQDRGFKIGKSSVNPYHHPALPGIRIVITTRVIRIEIKGRKKGYLRWNLSQSFSILHETSSALEEIDILLKEKG